MRPLRDDLTQKIIGLAMKIHRELGPGFLESVYHNALTQQLIRAGMKVENKKAIQVRYEGSVIGEFVADLFVEDRVIVEIKAVETLHPAHEIQTVNYLTATGQELGLLINFGAPSLQYKRKYKRCLPDRAAVRPEPLPPVNPL